MSTTPDVVITREPDGNVVAEGGDELAITLLKRAGFVIETTPRSFWYRLPWDLGEERENQLATHAARMLTAVGYGVDLDPCLDSVRVTTPTDPAGVRGIGHSMLTLVDHLNGAATYEAAADVVDEILDPDDGVLVRLGDFFEAAAVQANSVDTDGGWELSHLFEDAAVTVRDLGTDLHAASGRMRDLGPPPKRSWQEGVARYYASAPTRGATPATGVSDEPTAAGPPTPDSPTRRRTR
ncbi:hypothetical protein AB0D74_12500 [Streptomyces sp. NPDC048278]|uniref:hypothetical protein n=1 Tax=Streptomyces sp. NPDC048278 TaxID=3155809 RepID=UPI00344A5131